MKKTKKFILATLIAAASLGVSVFAAACDNGDGGDPNQNNQIVTPDKTGTLTITKPANGMIQASKTAYTVGDEITLTIIAAAEYHLSSLKINGVEKASEVANGKYTFKTDSQNISVTGAFSRNERAIDVSVSGSKFGVKGNSLANGTPVTLTHKYDDGVVYELAVEDGKLISDSVKEGEYDVKIDGYKALTLDVGENTAASLSFEYELLYNTAIEDFGWGASTVDFSEMNTKGVVKKTGGNTMYVSTKQSYDEIAFTTTLSSDIAASKVRQGVFIKFDTEFVFVQLEQSDDGSYKISWNNMNVPTGWTNITPGGWKEQVSRLSDKQVSEVENGTLEMTLVRSGKYIWVLVDGVKCATNGEHELADEYAEKSCQAGMYIVNISTEHVSKRFERKFKFASGDVKVTKTAENGQITLDKETYKVGEAVTITPTPKQDYKFKSLTVNGVDVTAQIWGGSYTIACVISDLDIEAEFEQIKKGNIDVAIKGHNIGDGSTAALANGVSVTLHSETLEDVSCTVSAGKITKINVVCGEYEVIVAGYAKKTVTVTEDGIIDEIVLEKEYFQVKGEAAPSASVDQAKLSEGKIVYTYINGTTQNKPLIMYTSDTYQNGVAFSVTLKAGQAGRAGIVLSDDAEKKDYVLALETTSTGYKICRHGGGITSQSGYSNGWNGNWTEYVILSNSNAAHKTDIQTLTNGTAKLTVVFKNNVIYVFLNEKYFGKFNQTISSPRMGIFMENGKTVIGEKVEKQFVIGKTEAELNAYLTKTNPILEPVAQATVTENSITGWTANYKKVYLNRNGNFELTYKVSGNGANVGFRIEVQNDAAHKAVKWKQSGETWTDTNLTGDNMAFQTSISSEGVVTVQTQNISHNDLKTVSGVTELEMKIVKAGNVITAYYKESGEWKIMHSVQFVDGAITGLAFFNWETAGSITDITYTQTQAKN